MIVHPWHGIEPGERAPEIVDCVIEVPRAQYRSMLADALLP